MKQRNTTHCRNFRSQRIRGYKVFIAFFCLLVSLAAQTGLVLADQKNELEFTAHRGASAVAPENTLAALEAAITQKAEYVEIDVNQTRDGVLVLLHDDNLARTTGVDINIWDINFEELMKLNAGKWFSPSYGAAPVSIPTLKQALDCCRGRIKLNIEVKYNGRERADYVNQIVAMVEQENMLEQCVITSYSYEILQRVKALNPTIKTGFISGEKIEDFNQFPEADIFSLSYTVLTPQVVEALHRIGKRLYVWTVDDELNLKKCKSYGVNNIITNDVKRARRILGMSPP